MSVRCIRCIAPYTAVIQQLFIQRELYRRVQRTTTTAMAVATRGTLSHVCLPCSERLERANRSGSGMGSGSERQQCAWERMGKRVQAHKGRRLAVLGGGLRLYSKF